MSPSDRSGDLNNHLGVASTTFATALWTIVAIARSRVPG